LRYKLVYCMARHDEDECIPEGKRTWSSNEQKLPNAPEVQPQGKVTNAKIREFLRMNPPSFMGSGTTEDPGAEEGIRVEDAPPTCWACFEEALLGLFFPRELKEAKKDSLSVHKYGLKFTQLSRYAPEMVADMKSRMSLFVDGAAMLIGDMDISRFMVYVQQVEEEKLRDRKEFRNKKTKTRNESGQQKSNVNGSSFQQKQKGPAPSSASEPAPKNKR
ncbi:hypothetical protein H5410_060914, partial [Solanum commersonii]